uniref:SCP domain-containing protein n=1 Tax=Strongyloides stercoralis TaxID=6248 RepID=A0A0K0E5N2_STRER
MQFFTLAIASFSLLALTSSEAVNSPETLKKIYDDHNCYRKPHGSEPLTVDKALEQQAQAYANKLANDNRGLVHSKSNGQYGENLAWGSGGDSNGIAAQSTKMWYDEYKKYDFNKATFVHGTGHFTQVVWKGSKSVGCGIAKSNGGGTFTVCQYKPAGNMMGSFKENVVPSKSEAPSC